MFNVLIVEDDKNVQKLLDLILKRERFHTALASDGAIALELMEKTQFDIVLLDAMMPNLDGFEFTKILREYNFNIPIIMITAKNQIQDKSKGFLSGVDDYMVKPIDEKELILRINALLRRAQINHKKIISFNGITLDYKTSTITRGKESISLPNKEFSLLFKLLSFPGRIFTKSELLEEIWGLESDSLEHTITVHINRLRNKFADFKEFEILTIRNLGYKAVIKNEER